MLIMCWLLVYSCLGWMILYVRVKKTGRSPNGNMLERLKKHEPRRTRSLLVVFNAWATVYNPYSCAGHGIGGDKSS